MSGPVGKYIEFIDGVPHARYAEPVSKQTVQTLLPCALAMPYRLRKDRDGEVIEDEYRFEGMINAEVIAIRRAEHAASGLPGSREDAEFIFDRVIGKPKQTIESTVVSVSYIDILNAYAAEDAKEEIAKAQAVDVVALHMVPDEEDLLSGV